MENSICKSSTLTYNGYTYELGDGRKSFRDSAEACRRRSQVLLREFNETLLEKFGENCPNITQSFWVGLRRDPRCMDKNKLPFRWAQNGTCVNFTETFPSYDFTNINLRSNRLVINLGQREISSVGNRPACMDETIPGGNCNNYYYVCQGPSEILSNFSVNDDINSIGSTNMFTTIRPSITSPFSSAAQGLSSDEITKIGSGVAAAAAFFLIIFLIHFLWSRKKQNRAKRLRNHPDHSYPKKLQRQIEEHIDKVAQRNNYDHNEDLPPPEVVINDDLPDHDYVNTSFHETSETAQSHVEKRESYYENLSTASTNSNEEKKNKSTYANLLNKDSPGGQESQFYENLPENSKDKDDAADRYANCSASGGYLEVEGFKPKDENGVEEYAEVDFNLYVNAQAENIDAEETVYLEPTVSSKSPKSK